MCVCVGGGGVDSCANRFRPDSALQILSFTIEKAKIAQTIL